MSHRPTSSSWYWSSSSFCSQICLVWLAAAFCLCSSSMTYAWMCSMSSRWLFRCFHVRRKLTQRAHRASVTWVAQISLSNSLMSKCKVETTPFLVYHYSDKTVTKISQSEARLFNTIVQHWFPANFAQILYVKQQKSMQTKVRVKPIYL